MNFFFVWFFFAFVRISSKVAENLWSCYIKFGSKLLPKLFFSWGEFCIEFCIDRFFGMEILNFGSSGLLEIAFWITKKIPAQIGFVCLLFLKILSFSNNALDFPIKNSNWHEYGIPYRSIIIIILSVFPNGHSKRLFEYWKWFCDHSTKFWLQSHENKSLTMKDVM